jgi:hypothetical protein
MPYRLTIFPKSQPSTLTFYKFRLVRGRMVGLEGVEPPWHRCAHWSRACRSALLVNFNSRVFMRIEVQHYESPSIALTNRRSAVSVRENGRTTVPCSEPNRATEFQTSATTADIFGGSSRRNPACGSAFCDLQIGTIGHRGKKYAAQGYGAVGRMKQDYLLPVSAITHRC